MINAYVNLKSLIYLNIIGLYCLIIFSLLSNTTSWKSFLFKNMIRTVSLITTYFSFLISLFLLKNININNVYRCNKDIVIQEYITFLLDTTPTFLVVDGISIFFIILTTFIILLCVLITKKNIKNNICYYGCLITINLLLILAFSTWHLLWFYIFFEALLIPMFIMINIWGSRERKIKAGYYFFLYTAVGSFFILTGLILIYLQTNTLFINQLLHYEWSLEKQKVLWLCFFIGFSVKIPTIPFHLWLPEAHVEAPTTGSVILASLLLKLGGYGFIRIVVPLFPMATNYYLPLVYTLTLISIIYASLIALRQIDIKKIIAYTSIAHMNIVVLGIFSLTFYGIVGAIFLMLAHGIVSGALFFCIGIIYERYHTRLLNYYGGLSKVMPIFSTFFLIFTLANLSFPSTCNFIGEFLILIGLVKINKLVFLFAASTMILSAAYSLWLFNRLCFGPIKHYYFIGSFMDLTIVEFYTLLPLGINTFLLGLKPNLILDIISNSVMNTLIFI